MQTIAWKTGTSYGFRDAWAVGVTPRYTVGVWVGNATGEGKPGLVGAQTAVLYYSIYSVTSLLHRGSNVPQAFSLMQKYAASPVI